MKYSHILRLCLLITVVLLLLFNRCFKICSLNLFKTSSGEYSVLTYNIHSTGPDFEKNVSRIAELIINIDADFIYLTEYYENLGDTIDEILRIHYPFSNTKHRWSQNEGDVFYSKWQIDSVCRFYVLGERIMAYRVQISQSADTIAMYCCHLASNNVDSQTTTMRSIHKGYSKRQLEVSEILTHIRKDKYPIIIVGDLNDVSGSPSLTAIEDVGFKDAWWEGGCGYGSTFHDGYFRLRIDHMMYDRNFDLCNICVLHADYSDHDALIGSFSIKRPN